MGTVIDGVALLARIRDADVRAATQGTVPVSGDLVDLSIRLEELCGSDLPDPEWFRGRFTPGRPRHRL